MSEIETFKHLHFLSGYDHQKRAEYLETIVRMLDADYQFETSDSNQQGWRTTQTAEPRHTDFWIWAKTGYVQKLVNEGVIKKTYDSNSYTHYRLNVPPVELARDVRLVERNLDAEHRDRLEALPY